MIDYGAFKAYYVNQKSVDVKSKRVYNLGEQSTHQVARRFLFIATNLIPLFDPESQGEKAPVLGELTAPMYWQLSPWDFVFSGANGGMMTASYYYNTAEWKDLRSQALWLDDIRNG